MFKGFKHIGIKATTDFVEAKTKLKDVFASTETFNELCKKLDMRRLKAD